MFDDLQLSTGEALLLNQVYWVVPIQNMDINKIDLNLLKVFDAIRVTGSVSSGAKLIGLSQPAMSAALAKMREQFHDPLFVRTAGGMVPTARGSELIEPIERILNAIKQDLLHVEGFNPIASDRTFVLSMSDIGEMVFLPKLLKHLASAAPSVRVKVVSLSPDRLEPALEKGIVDLAVGYFPDLAKNQFFQQRLFRHPFASIVRTDHPEIGDSLTMEQFLKIPHAIVSSTGRSQEIFDRLLEKQGLKRNVVLTVPHFMSVPFIVASSDLIVTLPRAVATSFSKLTKVKVLSPPMETPLFDLKQHWHERYHLDSANQWMREQIYELFREELAADGSYLPDVPEPWER